MKTIKLDENKNPFLPNKKMLKFFAKNTHLISEYPSINNDVIDEKIAQTFSIDKYNVMFGNGSMDIFGKLVDMFGDVTYGIISPSFWGFKHFLYLNNYKKWKHLELTNKNQTDLNNLEKLAKVCKVIYLCNTNNPSLQYFSKTALLRVIKAHPECHFVIDETLLTFEDFYQKSLFKHSKKLDNLSVVISISKIFGIAGLRVGILFSNKHLIARLKSGVVPFITNNLTEKFILKFLPIFNNLDEIRDKIYSNFKYLQKHISKKHITEIVNTNSSFINIFTDDKINLKDLKTYLEQHNILLRYSFELVGTSSNFLRVSSGTKAQYKKFIHHFNKYCRGI